MSFTSSHSFRMVPLVTLHLWVEMNYKNIKPLAYPVWHDHPIIYFFGRHLWTFHYKFKFLVLGQWVFIMKVLNWLYGLYAISNQFTVTYIVNIYTSHVEWIGLNFAYKVESYFVPSLLYIIKTPYDPQFASISMLFENTLNILIKLDGKLERSWWTFLFIVKISNINNPVQMLFFE